MPLKLWVWHHPKSDRSSGCMQTGVWVSGDCTQTDSKLYVQYGVCQIHSWTAGTSCNIMWAHHASVRKTVKAGPKCVLNPSQAEGGRDVCSAGGLSQIHTVIQMAEMLRLFHKQVHHSAECQMGVLTEIYNCNTRQSTKWWRWGHNVELFCTFIVTSTKEKCV